MADVIKELCDVLGDTPVRFGLRAQGHLPTIERMLGDGASWDEIGKVIGWHGPTAKDWYEREHVPPGAELRVGNIRYRRQLKLWTGEEARESAARVSCPRLHDAETSEILDMLWHALTALRVL